MGNAKHEPNLPDIRVSGKEHCSVAYQHSSYAYFPQNLFWQLVYMCAVASGTGETWNAVP
jgi:hypothetical protein